jgi:hypothetical protein
MAKARGRIVLAIFTLAIVAYLPLWSRCTLSTTPLTRLNPPQPVVVVTKPCPLVTAPPVASIVETHTTSTAVALSVRKPLSPYHVHIVVFTQRRVTGLKRLLRSLSAALYGGDDVSLTIFLDYPKKAEHLKSRDAKGADTQATRKFVAEFKWPHGRLSVHRRLANAGLKRTIMEAWFPPGADDEVAAFFEDDIEVSPYWYLWSAAALNKYAYPHAGEVDEKLLGISLFRPIHDELSGRSCAVKNDYKAFALQQPCSWGSLFLPKPWRAFRDWYDEFTIEGDMDPTVVTSDGGEPSSNTWARQSSWKKYLIKTMYDRGWYMVYPNPPGNTVLATNHLMDGEHPLPKRKLFELPLLQSDKALDIFIGEAAAERVRHASSASPADFEGTLPEWSDMWVYDVMFRRVDNRAKLLGQ